MASRGHPYTLVGFLEEVDRRPLFFVQPLPETRLCNACRLVPNVKALLPCEHSFCKPCHEKCKGQGVVACPVDGDACSDEEVTWVHHPARSVMAKQVFCWNHTNGCNVITTATDISKHFHQECAHHMARCPKCDTEILAADLCEHLQSHCDASSSPTAAAVQPRQAVLQEQEPLNWPSCEVSNGNSTSMCLIQAQLKEILNALKSHSAAPTAGVGGTDGANCESRLLQESLSLIGIQIGKLKDQFDEFMQNTNVNQQTFHNSFLERNEMFKHRLNEEEESCLNESQLAQQISDLKQEIVVMHFETKAEFNRMSVAIDSQYDRMGERFRFSNFDQEMQVQNTHERSEAHTDTLAHSASKIAWAQSISAAETRKILSRCPALMPVSTSHTWVFEGYGVLKQRVEAGYGAVSILRAVYLRGYCVSVGLCLAEDTTVCFFFQLHKGKIDQFLEWPLNLKIRFTIAHPGGYEKLTCCKTPRLESAAGYIPYLKPLGVTNVPDCVETTLSASELEKQGFIKDGRILLSLALEPLGNPAT